MSASNGFEHQRQRLVNRDGIGDHAIHRKLLLGHGARLGGQRLRERCDPHVRRRMALAMA